MAFLAVCGAENSRIWCLRVWGPRRDFKVSNGYRFIIWSLGGEAMIFGYSTLFYGWVFGPTNGSVWVFMDPTWNDFAVNGSGALVSRQTMNGGSRSRSKRRSRSRSNSSRRRSRGSEWQSGFGMKSSAFLSFC